MTPRLPPFVHGYIDRHGKPRYYLRRKGFVKVPLPGAPWSTQFMDAHAAALAGQPIIEPGRGRAKAGTMNALAMSYMAAPAFTLLADNSRRNYRRAIERFCNQHGDKLVAELQRKHVIKLMAALSDRPQAANQLRKMLRALMQHAVDIDIRPDDPTRDTKPIKIRSAGHHPWTEQEIEQFEQHHPVGTRQRLALDLLLYSGQRSGDVRPGAAAHSTRRYHSPAGEDPHRSIYPDTSEASGDTGCNAIGTLDVHSHRQRHSIQGRELFDVVQEGLPSRKLAALLRARSTPCGRQAAS